MSLSLAGPTLTPSADLGTVTVAWEFDTAPGSTGGNYNAQLFAHRVAENDWVEVTPRDASGAPIVFALYPGPFANRGTFTDGTFKAGTYDVCRLLLFDAGSNFGAVSWDSATGQNVPFALTVTTTQKRITQPTLDFTGITTTDSLSIGYSIKLPAGFTTQYSGIWVQAKTGALPGGFVQEWVDVSHPQTGTDPLDDYGLVTGTITAPLPAPGLYNLQGGLFNYGWQALGAWVYPGETFSYGSWGAVCPPSQYPAVAAALTPPGHSPVALGGNFGNAVIWTETPANVSAGYFVLLKAQGLTVLRVLVSPDQYLTDPTYVQVVDNIIECMLLAGVVPCLGPQDLPVGNTLADQEAALLRFNQAVATKYAGVPLIQDILNEPHAFGSWGAWKPVAEAQAQAIRAINPHAMIVCPFEGYSESGRGAEADPLPAGLVDLYAAHLYHTTTEDIPAAIGGSLPVWVQEYHNTDPAFHAALAQPNVKAVAAWAWTTPGQDSLPLVSSQSGASLTPSPDGAAILALYAEWTADGALSVPAPAPPPAPPLTTQDISAAITAATGAIVASIHQDEGTLDALAAAFGTLAAQVGRPLADGAQFVSQSVPGSMTPGHTYPVSLTFRNSGTSFWTTAGGYHLGSQSPQDNTTWGTGREILTDLVAPGATATLAFTVTAPSAPGTYTFQWRPVHDGVQWFGAASDPVTVHVA